MTEMLEIQGIITQDCDIYMVLNQGGNEKSNERDLWREYADADDTDAIILTFISL